MVCERERHNCTYLNHTPTTSPSARRVSSPGIGIRICSRPAYAQKESSQEARAFGHWRVDLSTGNAYLYVLQTIGSAVNS